MTIDQKTLSQRLSLLCEEQRELATRIISSLDSALYTVILIEAARVMDYETSIMGLSSDDAQLLKYPDFDVLSRGWNPLLAFLLPKIPELAGIPIQESSPESRGRLRSILHAFGKIAVLKKASDMAFHGFLVGEDIDGVLNLTMPLEADGDHFLDQLEGDKLDKIQNADSSGGPKNSFKQLSTEEVNQIISTLVFPFETGHGKMVGYGADPRLDEHFYGVTVDRATEWRAEAGLHPDLETETLDGSDLGVVMLLMISFYMKHIWFVGRGARTLTGINYAMSLTIWKDPEELVTSISEFSGIPENRVRETFKAIVVTREDSSYFAEEGSVFVPLLIEVSKGYWLAPISSVFRNPFEAVRMLGEHRHPTIGPSIRAPRENWMIEDLSSLFQGNRYRLMTSPTRLKRSNVTITDIDAAIFDVMTGELALFQLKWQDFGSNKLSKIRSRASNFVKQVDDWAKKTEGWIDEFGLDALCKNLQLKVPGEVSKISVALFAIGRSNARFRSYGYSVKNDKIAVVTWKQFIRLRLQVGPDENVLSEIHSKAMSEKTYLHDRRPIPYQMQVGEKTLTFENMWSLSD